MDLDGIDKDHKEKYSDIEKLESDIEELEDQERILNNMGEGPSSEEDYAYGSDRPSATAIREKTPEQMEEYPTHDPEDEPCEDKIVDDNVRRKILFDIGQESGSHGEDPVGSSLDDMQKQIATSDEPIESDKISWDSF